MKKIAFKSGDSNYYIFLPIESRSIIHKKPPQFLRAKQIFPSFTMPEVSSVAIVISDKTRLCQYPVYLPMLTDLLLQSNIRKKNITFFIAYGTHSKQSDEECLACYGNTYKQFRFIHHDAKDKSEHIILGKTTFGTNISFRKDILKSDLIITFGAISHHYFAGFGGGRKLLFPGLGGYDDILQNHKQLLNFDNYSLNTECQSGNIVSNPIALDLEEISATLPHRIELYAILNSLGDVFEIIKGESYSDFKIACARYDSFFRSEVSDQFDLVIASAGGYPKDINFIQTHKAIHNASLFVKDGGDLILFARCKDGIGNDEFIKLFMSDGKDCLFDKMKTNYENNGGTALSLMEKTKRINIHMITSLTNESCVPMQINKISSELARELIEQESCSIAYIENASMIYR